MKDKKLHRFPGISEEGKGLPVRQENGIKNNILTTGKEIDNSKSGEENGTLVVEELEQKITTLEQENAGIKNRLLRLQADFDNFRKRVRAEKEEMFTLANFNLVQKILPAIDNLERALSALQESPAGIREGLEMVKKHFMEILFSEGVTPIKSSGELFDPHFHEAVLKEDNSDYPPGTVVEELQKGYIMHGRVLRASKVKVSAD